jgi:hypothetical protein
VVGLPPGESYFAAGAQELVTHTVDLSKAIAKRVTEIDDFVLKRRFEDASTTLRARILRVKRETAKRIKVKRKDRKRERKRQGERARARERERELESESESKSKSKSES